MKRYFYITIHFSPRYEDDILTRVYGDVFINNETGDYYRKRLLYDFGFGQENGFELLPQLSFDELIKLVEINYVINLIHSELFNPTLDKLAAYSETIC